MYFFYFVFKPFWFSWKNLLWEVAPTILGGFFFAAGAND
jgi:hypothetical protein